MSDFLGKLPPETEASKMSGVEQRIEEIESRTERLKGVIGNVPENLQKKIDEIILKRTSEATASGRTTQEATKFSQSKGQDEKTRRELEAFVEGGKLRKPVLKREISEEITKKLLASATKFEKERIAFKARQAVLREQPVGKAKVFQPEAGNVLLQQPVKKAKAKKKKRKPIKSKTELLQEISNLKSLLIKCRTGRRQK